MARPAAPAAADMEKKFLAAVDFAKNGIDLQSILRQNLYYLFLRSYTFHF